MGLRTFFRDMSRTYRILNEREQELSFRKLEPERWLPAPVDFGKYRIVFTDSIPNGFLANVFIDGRLLGTTKVTRWLERGVPGPEEGRELKLKLSIGDIGVMRMSEIEYDEPPGKE